MRPIFFKLSGKNGEIIHLHLITKRANASKPYVKTINILIEIEYVGLDGQRVS